MVVVWVALPSSGSVRRGGAGIQQPASKWDVRVDLNMSNTFIEITFLHFAGVLPPLARGDCSRQIQPAVDILLLEEHVTGSGGKLSCVLIPKYAIQRV